MRLAAREAHGIRPAFVGLSPTVIWTIALRCAEAPSDDLTLMRRAIPKYFLYGESSQDVDEHFLHVESIAERSRLHNWNISPHAHGNLHHLLLITNGGGVMQAEESANPFAQPTLIRVPLAYVHGFAFEPDTDGWIATVSDALLGRIKNTYPELRAFSSHANVVPLSAPAAAEFERLFRALVTEFHGTELARIVAVESQLLAILVAVLRAVATGARDVEVRGNSDSMLVARYRALVEDRYRSATSVAEYAAHLCVSQERLRLACVRNAGTSPLALLIARRLLEAKRGLLYTNMTVAQIAHGCGFDDPAYFCRFFTRETGESPRTYRRKRTDLLPGA